eukprot:COSAG02_NODE_43356_length_375_cov_1.315217_1_plen_27_part_10
MWVLYGIGGACQALCYIQAFSLGCGWD